MLKHNPIPVRGTKIRVLNDKGNPPYLCIESTDQNLTPCEPSFFWFFLEDFFGKRWCMKYWKSCSNLLREVLGLVNFILRKWGTHRCRSIGKLLTAILGFRLLLCFKLYCLLLMLWWMHWALKEVSQHIPIFME